MNKPQFQIVKKTSSIWFISYSYNQVKESTIMFFPNKEEWVIFGLKWNCEIIEEYIAKKHFSPLGQNINDKYTSNGSSKDNIFLEEIRKELIIWLESKKIDRMSRWRDLLE